MNTTMTWQEWKDQMWDTLTTRYGPRIHLCALEQYQRRSQAEKRCVECGAPGTVKVERSRASLIQSVSHYWFCQDCADYWAAKA